MIFHKDNPLEMRNAVTYFNHVLATNEVFEIRTQDQISQDKVEAKRTRRQNSYLHIALSWFALQYGATMALVKEELYKKLCNRDLYVTVIEDRFAGVVESVRSSKELTVEEMTLSIERFRNWSASEAGIYIPSPEEHELLEIAKMEIDKFKKWL